MVGLTLDKPWTYRTPQKTIDYPAGTHEVFAYIADAYAAENAPADPAPAAEQSDDTEVRTEAVKAVHKRKDG